MIVNVISESVVLFPRPEVCDGIYICSVSFHTVDVVWAVYEHS